ncbi:hypothetical protein J41TS12_16230 [Paenibacillus antibioticophila]|uniref:Uncharacterized protein n=1 Tax=Paenibacillus antibioticophila TaxID=1274374 RepID=A0A920CHH6_9BACL|nr:hypothetical protein [Paenibacillus antibioticophila]GIO36762.1 hypothetical protein J41TS12_16230 [Paenibacillus antibioticophila]
MVDAWQTCPSCKSKNVITRTKRFYFLLFFGLGGVLLWIGLMVYWPLLIAGFIAIIISMFSFMMPRVNRCRDCGHKWKP